MSTAISTEAAQLVAALRVGDDVAQLLVTPKPLTPAQRDQLRPHANEELVDSLLTIQPRTAAHAEPWFRMVARLALVKPQAMSSEKVKDKLVVLAAEHSKAPSCVHWASVCVNNITASTPADAPPPPPAAANAAETAGAAAAGADAVAVNARAMYCTSETRALFCSLARALCAADSAPPSLEPGAKPLNPIEAEKRARQYTEQLGLAVTWLSRAVASSTYVHPVSGECAFAHEAMRSALVSLLLHPAANSSEAAFWAFAALSNITRVNVNDPAREQIFGTAEVRDALVHASRFATTAEAAQTFCGAIANITMSHDSSARGVFATAEVRAALVDVAATCSTTTSITLWCSALNNILLNSPTAKQLFATSAIREAFQLLALSCTTVDAAKWWVWALYSVLCIVPAHSDLRVVLAVPELRDALCCVSVLAAQDEAAASVLLDCIEKLVSATQTGQDAASASALRGMPSGAFHVAGSGSGSGSTWSEAKTDVDLSDLPPKEFATADLVACLLDILPKVTTRSLPKWKRVMVRVRAVVGGPSFAERHDGSSVKTSAAAAAKANQLAAAAAGAAAASNAAAQAEARKEGLSVCDSIFLPAAGKAPISLSDDDADDDLFVGRAPGALVKEASL